MDITFINYAGARKRLPARVGESLLQAAQRAKYEFVDGERKNREHATSPLLPSPLPLTLSHPPSPSPFFFPFSSGACGGGASPADVLHKQGGWYEPKYGEGAMCHFCHVIIPKTHYPLLPPKRPDELERLKSYPFPEDMTET